MTVTHEEVPGWTEPSATQRLRLLERTSSIAMVGVSKKPVNAESEEKN